VKAIHRLPLPVLPSALSTNVFLVAEPRQASPIDVRRPDDVAAFDAAVPALHPTPPTPKLTGDAHELAGDVSRR
jgi:hypothetical protein